VLILCSGASLNVRVRSLPLFHNTLGVLISLEALCTPCVVIACFSTPPRAVCELIRVDTKSDSFLHPHCTAQDLTQIFVG
jgi:hypothetical protein